MVAIISVAGAFVGTIISLGLFLVIIGAAVEPLLGQPRITPAQHHEPRNR